MPSEHNAGHVRSMVGASKREEERLARLLTVPTTPYRLRRFRG
jgi:hypothetical protein